MGDFCLYSNEPQQPFPPITLPDPLKFNFPKMKKIDITMKCRSKDMIVPYDAAYDQVEGYEDFGSLGRTKFITNHALVVMVRGIITKWKQPL